MTFKKAAIFYHWTPINVEHRSQWHCKWPSSFWSEGQHWAWTVKCSKRLDYSPDIQRENGDKSDTTLLGIYISLKCHFKSKVVHLAFDPLDSCFAVCAVRLLLHCSPKFVWLICLRFSCCPEFIVIVEFAQVYIKKHLGLSAGKLILILVIWASCGA